MRPWQPIDEAAFSSAVGRRDAEAAVAWLRQQLDCGKQFVSVESAVHTWRLHREWGTPKKPAPARKAGAGSSSAGRVPRR